MKRFLLILIIAVFAVSCVGPYSMQTSMIDLQSYSDRGFLMTPAMPLDHSPVSIVDVSCVSGKVSKQSARKIIESKNDPIYGFQTSSNPSLKPCSINDLVEELYLRCVDLGANGLFDLEIVGDENKMRVSGLAVKLNYRP